MMTWQQALISPDGTHHVLNGKPLYSERFNSVLAFHDPGFAPVERNGEAWHINPDGRPIYSSRFIQTFGFYESLAAVVSKDGWHHISPNGKPLYDERYSWCGNFQGGLCTVRNTDGSYYHITVDGKPAYTERWHYAGDFRDGIAVVQAKDGSSTNINRNGKLIHDQWFLDLDVFHKGYARARDKNGWMHIDINGDPVYSQRFSMVEPFYNGQARVERFDGALEIINEHGENIHELRTPIHSEFAELSSDLVGFWRTHTISAAVELGVFEVLPADLTTISDRCSLRPERARRLLSALSELSLVARKDDSWVLTSKGAYLRADHCWTLAGAALEYRHQFSTMWENLPDSMRINSNWIAPDLFGEVACDELRRESHHQMLLSYARHDYAEVPAAMALRGNEKIIDAGGGLGALSIGLVEHYPGIQVHFLERPEVIKQTLARNLNSGCIRCHSFDLFEPWGRKADAVVLARILHDWNDCDALRILTKARDALSPGGQLFIVEMIIDEDEISGSLCDLHLLMATGGQERTAKSYQALMEQSGFEVSEIKKLNALPSIILGVAK